MTMTASDGHSGSPGAGPLAIDRLVGRAVGPYRLEREIGRGGMSVVMAATHRATGKLVALKLLLPTLSIDAASMARLAREARVARRLKSPHAVTVLGSGSDAGGMQYIAMPLLEGSDLSRFARAGGLLPIDRVVELIAQACDAVGEAHELGVVHRDLKLANLFLANQLRGRPLLKVLDFGIAKPLKGQSFETATSLTDAGVVVGTPHYSAPEQIDGRREIGPVCLYRLLTARFPFDAGHALAVYASILSDVFLAPRVIRPEIPVELERLVLRCLRPDPRARFRDARALGRALSGVRASLPAPAPPPGPALGPTGTHVIACLSPREGAAERATTRERTDQTLLMPLRPQHPQPAAP
jgi:serine/threonine-protein kinase